MKKQICAVLAGLTIAATGSLHALADVYYPYPVYEEYYKKNVEPQPPQQAPANPPPPVVVLEPVPAPEQPIKLSAPPEFLFPRGLGFGVAIGIPEDLFYDAKAYYAWKGGNWYRALSYDGPWSKVPLGKVPAELRKNKLSRIRDLRNREFRNYWKNREHYKGRVFRPGEEHRTPLKQEKLR